MCEIFRYPDNDSNSRPYYISDISDYSFAGLTSMRKTMNEQQVEFANKIWEYYLLYETNLRFSPPKLDVHLFDDDASFPPL